MKYSFKSYCSYFLFFFLCSCGVKGPLFLPPASPAPSKPSMEEPNGKLYPMNKTSQEQSSPEAFENKSSNSTTNSSDNLTVNTPTIKK